MKFLEQKCVHFVFGILGSISLGPLLKLGAVECRYEELHDIKAKDVAKPISFSSLGERVHGTIIQVKPEKGTYIVKTTGGIERELEIEKAWRFNFDA